MFAKSLYRVLFALYQIIKLAQFVFVQLQVCRVNVVVKPSKILFGIHLILMLIFIFVLRFKLDAIIALHLAEDHLF